MGRPEKVTAQEILETIQDNGSITVAELIEIYKVCPATIRKRLQKLRDDGESIFHNENGLFIMESIDNEEDRIVFEKYLKWLLGAFKGLAKCGKVTKPLLIESKRYLKESLSAQERKQLTNYTAQVNRILSNIELEEEME